MAAAPSPPWTPEPLTLPPELDPIASEIEARDVADHAVSLLSSWTRGKAGEADEILCAHAVDTARAIHQLARQRGKGR